MIFLLHVMFVMHNYPPIMGLCILVCCKTLYRHKSQPITIDCCSIIDTRALIWWCHDIEMLSTLLALCEGNPLVNGEFPSQGTDVFSAVSLDNPLIKWSSCQWFETLWCDVALMVITGTDKAKYVIDVSITVFGAGFENNLSVGQVAQKIHLSWCCPKLSQIKKNIATHR